MPSSHRRRHMLSRLNPFGRRARKPGDLALRAGERPEMLEQLERRQMLFTLTVNAPDPGLDVGTVRAFFGYTIPYIAPTSAAGIQGMTQVLEDFDSDDPAAPPANIPAGFIFDESNLQLNYTPGQLSVARLVGADQENSLQFNMQQGESFSFKVTYGPDGKAQFAFIRFKNPTTFSMNIDTTGGGAFDPLLVTVELRLNGQVVTSFTGTDLFNQSTPVAVGIRNYAFTVPAGQSFDEVRFVATGGPVGPFRVDDVRFAIPPGNFAQIINSRIFGTELVYTGPVGSSVQVLDLYGREMIQTIILGAPAGGSGSLTIVDADDDGIPDYNDGIGKIIITGSNRDSAITIFGGTIESFNGAPPVEAEFTEGLGTAPDSYAFLLVDDIVGQLDDFEAGGFGYNAVPTQPGAWRVTGSPPGPGSVVVGAPYERPLADYRPGGVAPLGTAFVGTTAIAPFTGFFNRADQGIFANSPISSVYLHGVLHGNSVFSSWVDRIVTGYMVGSATVAGDLGYLTSGSDAGLWVSDDGVRLIKTGGTLTVGRTLGEFVVAGRTLLNVTVIGDLNSPATRPPRDVLRYAEHEWTAGVLTPSTDLSLIRVILANNDFRAQNRLNASFGIFFDRFDQGLIFGSGTIRNDTILGAEWIGSVATAVQINGDLGFTDPVNGTADPSDVYAFAADGTQDIVVQLDATLRAGLIGAYMRIVDQDGRTLAAPQAATRQSEFVGMRFRPNAPGVYYLVVQSPNSATLDYVINLSGMASTAFGSFRSGAGAGRNGGLGNTVQVLSGGMGSMRVGTGFVDGGGAEIDPVVTFNPIPQTVSVFDDNADEYMALREMTLNVSGNLYNITTGSDIQDNQAGGGVFTLSVSENLGNLVTGMSVVVGRGFTQGDFRFLNFNIGGSIGVLDIRGALGFDQDGQQAFPVDFPDSVIIRTGTRTGTNPSLKGDIGFIRVGSNSGGGTLNLQTSAGSVIGGYAVNQDGGNRGISFDLNGQSPTGQTLVTGFNSDVRFFDTPRIDLNGFINHVYPLTPGVPLQLTDDAGGRVFITIVGGNANATGNVRAIPISGSLGVAIGRITVNLDGGAQLQIQSQGPVGSTDVISIGRIVITDADANSTIAVSGNSQLDIWQISQVGGDAFGGIVNGTPLGDVVVADMAALANLVIGTGDLGRTQVLAWGPKLIGPAIGVVGGAGGGQGGFGQPVTVPAGNMTQYWNGNGFRPVNNSAVGIPNPLSFIDDVGSPVDPFLDGLIVRTGNTTLVQAGGAIGDVIMADQTAGNGVIQSIIANADAITLLGRFDGIVGTIYANRIAAVDIGDGLAQRAQSPMATTGIFANDDIGSVFGTRIAGAFISSVIDAANDTPGNTDGTFPTDGINIINLTGGGDFVDAFVGGMSLDAWWSSFFSFDDVVFSGDINLFTGTSADFLRSQLWARGLVNMTLTGGFWDASQGRIRNNVGLMQAVGYRNSTISGGDQEFVESRITVGGNVTQLTTINRAGDIDDLVLDVNGTVFEISANNMSRTSINVDIETRLILTVGDLRAVELTTGLLTQGTIGRNIRSSQISVAGPLISLIVADSVTNTSIDVSGPDGRLDLLRVRTIYTGSIAVAGPTNLIEVTQGDLIARILTVVNQRGIAGNINQIIAGRDIDIDADIGGTITRLVAGRHLGNRAAPNPIVVHGDVVDIDVSHGQMYSDFRIDQRLTGSLRIGAVDNRPGAGLLGAGSLIAFGAINGVVIEGDFGGRIISYSGGIANVTINNGSLLPTGSIQAYDGDIGSVIINAGSLFGNIHADYILYLIQLNADANGVFGDIGINPDNSQAAPFSALRNQLPPGVVADSTIQGPRITAGFNIGRITLTNGSIFETFIHAARAIGTIDVNGSIRNDPLTSGTGTVISAGSLIHLVNATGNIQDTIIIAGIRAFGNDGRPGGVGPNADAIQSGRIETVTAGGSGVNVIVTAGMNAGADGVYNTGDESVALGVSFVQTVTFAGGSFNASVFGDVLGTVSPGVVTAGIGYPMADPDVSNGNPAGAPLTPGVPLGFNLPGGISGTITFSGPGSAFFDLATRRVVLISTTLESTLVVSANGTLTDFDIVTGDDASMGSIAVAAPLAGDSDIVVDAYCLSITVGDFSGTGSIKVGMNVRSITTGNFTGGFIQAAYWARDIVINGNFGSPNLVGEARIDVNAGSTMTINGTFSGLVNVERDLSAFTVNGAVVLAQFRAGGSVGAFTSGAMSQSRVSIGDHFGPIIINGNVTESNIQAGGDLGADAAPGGTGFDADRVSTGSIFSVRVNGNFTRSSITAGMLRGPDGYFGTADDSAAAGRSNVGAVTITGNQVGSNLGSESFRVSGTGVVGLVTVGGQVVTQSGNFRVESLATRVNPLRVQDLVVSQSSQTWNATIFFNQSIDASTVPGALSIFEVRDAGLTIIPLVQGVDYTIVPTTFKDRVLIQFSRAVTDRNLTGGNPAPGVPGPGVFRFVLSAAVLRATVGEARLDADPATALLNDYSQDAIVGDAGDKLVSETVTVNSANIDMYAPVDLNVVLDNNLTPDGLADPNLTYTLRGVIGDHPDHNLDFGSAGDTDVYKITLRAGQILRLGALQGAAALTGRFLFNAAGDFQFGVTPDTYLLPSDPATILDLTQPEDYLIKTTGTYYIALGNALFNGFTIAIPGPGVVPNLDPGVSDTGEYSFTLQVFDDGDSGFAAPTASGNGTPVVDAPAAIVFAGPNQVFNNPGDPGYDDLTVVQIGDYVFTLDPGANGIREVTDLVTGTNGQGISSTRQGSQARSVINSAIGPRGHSGVPGDFAPDVDVFLLNNGQTIEPGRTITIKIQLADLGADLGSFSRITFDDFRGDVQFGIFDVTGATGLDDGVLLTSPTDFRSIAQPARNIASQGPISYGYDANGDFFITFVTSGRIGGLPTDAAAYAVYLQGVFNTDYTIEVTQNVAAPPATITQNRQNVFIETRGGLIDWLQAGGLTTELAPFSAAVLGYTGTALNGQNVGDYILSNLVAKLNSVFAATGLNVFFSTDPNAFEFQPFSTVFISATTDPVTIFNTDNFGYSEHSDPFNADLTDEAVLFLPSFAQLGYTPAQADIDNFVLSLTAAVGRRVGELTGLRIEANESPLTSPVNIMAANSVFRFDGQSTNYGYSNVARALSPEYDSIVNTNFFLGQQNAFALLDKFLLP